MTDNIPDEVWIDVVAAVGWDESNELWPVLQKALAAALPVVTADLVAEIQQKDTELDEWRNGTRRLPVERDAETREAIAAELNVFASSFAEGRDALTAAGCPSEGAILGGAAKALREHAASLRGEQ